MKISWKKASGKQVYDVRLGTRPVKALYRGADKIYPDDSARIRSLRLDMAAWEGTLDGIYWATALDNVTVSADAARCIRLTADRSYMVGSTWGAYPLAEWMGSGLFRFQAGEGPLVRNVRLGDTAALRLRLGSCNSLSIGGSQGDDNPVSRLYPACPPGTIVRGYYTKGQKRVSTGADIIVESRPSGQILVNRHIQQDGHCRGSYDWPYAVIDPVPGDTEVLLTVRPHQARGPWGGYFTLPGLSRTQTARIIQITPEP